MQFAWNKAEEEGTTVNTGVRFPCEQTIFDGESREFDSTPENSSKESKSF